MSKHNSLETKIKRKIFYYCEKIRKEPVFDKFYELQYNQTQSYNFIKEYQLIKLKALIIYAYKNSPFYKAFYSSHDISLFDLVRLKNIEKLPIMTKKIIRQNLKFIPPGNDTKIYPVKTSGSTGAPLKFYKDRVASAYSYAAMYRGHMWYGTNICDKEAYLWGIPLSKKEFIAIKLRDFLLNRFREKKFELTDEVNFRFYKKILQKKPKILSGYATLIYEFARFIKNKNLNIKSINIKVVKYTAEMMQDYQKELIQSVFLCPVVSEYGSAETGIVAFECPQGGNHLLADCVYVEFKKDKNTGFYKLLITNLNAWGFPIIRYDTGDLVEFDKLSFCSCGLPFPVMSKIIGRRNDIIITPEGKRMHSNIFSYIIKSLLSKYTIIDQLRFIQTKTNEFKVLISLYEKTKYEKICLEIMQYIRQNISKKMSIVFELQDKIEREESGKLRYFISNLEIDRVSLKNSNPS